MDKVTGLNESFGLELGNRILLLAEAADSAIRTARGYLYY